MLSPTQSCGAELAAFSTRDLAKKYIAEIATLKHGTKRYWKVGYCDSHEVIKLKIDKKS